MKEFSFLIVAGGSGRRIGGMEKQFRLLGGRPLWRWSVELAESLCDEGIEEIVLVLPEGREEREEDLSFCHLPWRIVSGGATRSESVQNGLAVCAHGYVMVHDAARPFADRALLRALMDNTSETTGAIPVMPLAEAVKRIDRSGSGECVSAVDRDGLYATQTPQSFSRETLIRVLRKYGTSVKDEAEAWLAAGLDLRCIEGGRLNFKVTWPEDLQLASALAEEKEGRANREMKSEIRTGIGYDVHRLVPERPLILGGVVVDSPLGLLGHSDADLVAHAVADAILGAAGLPDIGNLFPASDNKYKDADSLDLLREAVSLTTGEGWSMEWVDVVVEAQIPRLNAHLPEMKERLSSILNPGGENCVGLKVKSAEKTNDGGAGKSMSCWAIATLRREREAVK